MAGLASKEEAEAVERESELDDRRVRLLAGGPDNEGNGYVAGHSRAKENKMRGGAWRETPELDGGMEKEGEIDLNVELIRLQR